MGRMFRIARTLVIPVLLGISLSACALGRSEIELGTPASAVLPANPAGPAVKISEIRDLRRFTVNPSDPSEPSIGNANEINDPKITSRIVGRKRGGFGAALGDVALPEGKTIQTLIQDAARNALHTKGYRVVTEGSPDYAAAPSMTLDIEQFWAWFNPGFWSVKASNKSRVLMSGEPIGASPATAEAIVSSEEFAVTDAVWQRVIQTGLTNLTEKIAEKIRPASELRR